MPEKEPSSRLPMPDQLYDEEIERVVLGSVLINPSLFLTLAGFLRADDFYLERHRWLWKAMEGIAGRGEPIEYHTLRRALESLGLYAGFGGDLYLSDLFNSTSSAVYGEQYGRLLERDAVRRRLLEAGHHIQQVTLDRESSVEEILAKAESALFAVSERRAQRDVLPMREAASRYFEQIEVMMQQQKGGFGLPSGFRKLDALLGGLQKSDLLIFAGRPGMGKTSFMLSLALNASFHYGARIALFTLEMGAEQIVQRMVSMETGINMQRLRTGQFDNNEYGLLVEAIGRLSEQTIFIDDSPSLTPVQMRTKCQRIKYEYGLDLVILDYIQLMSAQGYENNRVQEVSYISRALKELAREMNVPVLGAAQLSRAVEQRADKRPQLSDLRESGCLAGDTRIYLPDSGQHVPIADLVGQSGFRVLSLNPATDLLEPAEVSNAFYTGCKPVYKLKTALGYEIRATGNHPFLTIQGWKRLDELAVGEHVALPRRLPQPDSTVSSMEAKIALLGHLIGDGCTLPRHAIQYTTVEYDLAEIVSNLAKEAFGDEIVPRIYKEKNHNWYQVFLAAAKHLTHNVRNPIAIWLEQLGLWGKRSYEKQVPSAVFAESNANIGLFLRHLWSTDGSIRMRKTSRGVYPSIFYASSSRPLIDEVQSLLLRLDIRSVQKRSIQKTSSGAIKGRDMYNLYITGIPDLARFVNVIGAVGQKKNQNLLLIQNYIADHQHNPNKDVIPFDVWRMYAVPAAQSLQMTSREIQAGLGMSYCGTSLYKQNISRERAARLATVVKSEKLMQLAQSDIYWDSILSIEPDGQADVYDLTVPTHSNFVANNIVVHNSLEQDADIVMFLYRDVVYNEATENPNQADVIIAKHRNGPTDTIPLYFDPTLTKFMDGTR
ncbi:MAG: replicative DNA helicase, partial [Phototrophicaceae bacterium]